MITILANATTDLAKQRMEELARAGGYRIEQWLVPASEGLKVAATMTIRGQKHGLGFRWGGEDLNVLAQRCMSLDLAMTMLPEAVARGGGAPWPETH